MRGMHMVTAATVRDERAISCQTVPLELYRGDIIELELGRQLCRWHDTAVRAANEGDGEGLAFALEQEGRVIVALLAHDRRENALHREAGAVLIGGAS